MLSLAWAAVVAATGLVLWISDGGVLALVLTLATTGLGVGLGVMSPWPGSASAAWRGPADRSRG